MMELIDIITSQGAATGITKPRAQVHIDGDWHRTVHVWVMDNKQDVLLQKRAAAKESHPGLWDVSCAGHIQAGGASRHAAVRELQEELGLFVQPEALQYLFRVPSFFVLNKGSFIDREMVDVYLLVRNIDPMTSGCNRKKSKPWLWYHSRLFKRVSSGPTHRSSPTQKRTAASWHI